MKRTLMLTLLLCLLLLPGVVLANDCSVCSGDLECDTCGGSGVVTYHSYLAVYGNHPCTAHCNKGICPICPEPCDICGGDRLCNFCNGSGLIQQTADSPESSSCVAEYCQNGICIACRNGQALARKLPSKIYGSPTPKPRPRIQKNLSSQTHTNNIYVFADPVIAKYVAKQLHKSSSKITEQDLLRIEEISLSKADYVSLTDLAMMPNLKALSAFGCRIDNLHALKHLTGLKHLSLMDAGISDIHPLENLTELTSLSLDFNKIKDITPLKKLMALNYLSLDRNLIQDINPLKNLTALTSISLSRNQIQDVSPLKNLTALTRLHMSSNSIIDIGPLASLINLRYVYLDNNQIADIRALSGMDALSALDLSNNQIVDLSPLAYLKFQLQPELSGNPSTSIPDPVIPFSSVIPSPVFCFSDISSIRLAEIQHKDNLTIYQYTGIDYPLQWEYLNILTQKYKMSSYVGGRAGNIPSKELLPLGAECQVLYHLRSGGSITVVIKTVNNEKSFTIYAYDGITLSDDYKSTVLN